MQPIREHEEHDIYFGSTSVKYLCERMGQHKHKRDSKKWEADSCSKVMCYELFDKYGFDNCLITLIENVNANTKEELL